MDNSNSGDHPVKTKLFLLDWFQRSQNGQRAGCEAQWTEQRTNVDDAVSSEDPVGCSNWSVEPSEVEETPLAKRVIE